MKNGNQRNLTKDRKKTAAQSTSAKVVASSGNVFADLRLPNAPDALAKAELARRICQIVEKRKLTQAKAAQILGLDQPKVSALMRGKLDGFSTERLFRCLNALGQEVEILIRPTHSEKQPAITRVVLIA